MSSSDSDSFYVSRDNKKRRKDNKYRSRSRDTKRKIDNRREKDKLNEKSNRRKSEKRSTSKKHKKRYRSSSSSFSKRKRSYSNDSKSSKKSIELRSRSTSKNKKIVREEKLKKERREKKYDTEVDKLKEREIDKQKDYEKKLTDLKKKAKEDIKIENNLKPLTEEENQEALKKYRLAKARVFVLVEREEEKKNEEMLIENSNIIQDDFLEDKKKSNFELEEEEFEYYKDHDNEANNISDNRNISENNKLENNNNNLMIIDDKQNEIIIPNNVESEADKINVTLGHRNMPNLPLAFFSQKNKTKNVFNQKNENNNKNKNTQFENTIEDKFNKTNSSKKSEIIKNKQEKKDEKIIIQEEDEDPLDKYMKEIEKDATLQDYQIYQELYKQLQKRYDEVVAKDDEQNTFFNKDNDYDSDQVKIIEDKFQMEIDDTKVITFEEIMKLTQEQNHQGIFLFNKQPEDESDKQFIQTLKDTEVPDIDPLYGYSSQKNAVVLYQEDYNEYMKEDTFNDVEEAWLKLRKSATERKELKLVNHSLINYELFKKNLYVECKEISNLTHEQIEQIRKNNGDIKVRGKNICNPILNWYQCGLSDRILDVLEKKGFKTPFPIQAQAIPCIMSGRDVIGIAETGSGKTLAYVLPMLRHVMDQRALKVIYN